ncbi:hypothetical protein IU421_13465 [Nocardia cyriacigeorgica]|uniref:hypothetical protein n=1 Tax=Nocardia cyriacigeorgica TaxID=135487 RepID=UPI001894E465|nr:hypothetical protein [Nocardia cyriacigeorgica]MBF6515290.1 hypothetical protein [Nocardia cyriacigeorgica]
MSPEARQFTIDMHAADALSHADLAIRHALALSVLRLLWKSRRHWQEVAETYEFRSSEFRRVMSERLNRIRHLEKENYNLRGELQAMYAADLDRQATQIDSEAPRG